MSIYVINVTSQSVREITECFQMNLGKVAHYIEKKLDICLTPHKGEPQKD